MGWIQVYVVIFGNLEVEFSISFNYECRQQTTMPTTLSPIKIKDTFILIIGMQILKILFIPIIILKLL